MRPQLQALFLAKKADEVVDRFTGFVVEPVFCFPKPLIGFPAELQRQAEVGMTDSGANAVRLIAKPKVLVQIGSTIETPFLLRLPLELPAVQSTARVLREDLKQNLDGSGNIIDMDDIRRVSCGHFAEILEVGRRVTDLYRILNTERRTGILEAQPGLPPQRLRRGRLRKERRWLDLLNAHRAGSSSPALRRGSTTVEILCNHIITFMTSHSRGQLPPGHTRFRQTWDRQYEQTPSS